MGLSRRDLAVDEEVVVEFRGHRGALLAPLLGVLLLVGAAGLLLMKATGLPLAPRQGIAAVLIALPLSWFCLRALRWRSRSITLTTQRLVVSRGNLRKHSEQVRLLRIVEVHVDQGVIERLLGRGRIAIDLIDGEPVVIDEIPHPAAMQRLVLRQVDECLTTADEQEAAPPHWPEEPSRLARVRIVTELDPTPPRGIPAVSGSSAQSLMARLDEVDRLEADGLLSGDEARRRRAELGGAL